MAEHRALVLINGDLQQMPVGDLLSNHKVLVVNSGEIYQSNGTDYPVIKPLVMINNEISQLPDGDTLAGAGPTIDYTIDLATPYVIVGTPTDSIKMDKFQTYIVSGNSIANVSLIGFMPYLVHGSLNRKNSLQQFKTIGVHGFVSNGASLASFPTHLIHGTGKAPHTVLGCLKTFAIWKPTS